MEVSALSERVQKMHKEITEFLHENIYPVEPTLSEHQNSADKWTHHPVIDSLKVRCEPWVVEEGMGGIGH